MNRLTARRRRGFLMLDTVTGILLLAAIAILLATAAGRQRLAATRLADQRAAIRLAEQVLIVANHAGAPTTAPAMPDNVELRRLDTPAPAGTHWTQVTATVNGHKASLCGLVRDRTEGDR